MLQPIRDISKAVLGGDHRLEIAAEISASEHGAVRTGDIAKTLGLTSSEVSKELRHFRQAGLLERFAHGEYERRHEPFWQGCAALLVQLRADVADD